ncbi:hypothetical protein [Corynebacterium auriscanis]|uniref:hypothetical protein n=1 Tax=Corynebacterium auriscanis TaxID=99807 RepID=UPI002246E51F|nr:hypothetical protein [Corynebacterium auriscanis]MCX2164019.1 hypothetical protein [Corynebacterium auriscanis]
MGDVTGQVPPGAGWNRQEVAWQRWQRQLGEVLFRGEPLEQENEQRERVVQEWQVTERVLDRGEGYVPIDAGSYSYEGKHLYWVQIENDLHRRKRKIATIYCAYENYSPRRSFWSAPAELFAVYRHKGRYPNPLDAVPGVGSAFRECFCVYPQNDGQLYADLESWQLDGVVADESVADTELDQHLDTPLPKQVRNVRDSYAPGVKPVGVRVEGDVWVFPHGVRIGTDDLVKVLTWFRQRGVQTVGLSQLKFFSECRIG